MENCIFCKIIRGEIPAQKIYEDKDIIAFLDVRPVNIGHALVLPKAHYLSIYDTPDQLLAALMPVIKKLSIAIKSAVDADGINVEMNNGPAAGQLVFHTHIHIVPRFNDDGFKHWRGARGYSDQEMEQVQNKIKAALE